jgi:hypothetical protein
MIALILIQIVPRYLVVTSRLCLLQVNSAVWSQVYSTVGFVTEFGGPAGIFAYILVTRPRVFLSF